MAFPLEQGHSAVEPLRFASLLTYVARQLSPSETHADDDTEAVGVVVVFMAVWGSDVDGCGQ